jgi:uncharacterized OB-fold protein
VSGVPTEPSRRAVFDGPGLHDPVPDLTWPEAREFWSGVAQHALRMPRCTACEALVWYPRPTCAACGHSELAWETLSGRGTLFSWVVVRRAFAPAFADWVPFTMGVMSLEEDAGVRLVGRMPAVHPDEVELLEIGSPVHVAFEDLTFSGGASSLFSPVLALSAEQGDETGAGG